MGQGFIVTFFDVGQAQASMATDLQTRTGVIVDCGPGSADLLTRQASSLEITVTLVIITHLDMDHCSDLLRVIRALGPTMVRLNSDSAWKSDTQYPKLLTLVRGLRDWSAQQRPARWRSALDETAPDDPSVGRMHWRILAPEQADVGSAHLGSRRNAASVVLTLVAGGVRVLYTGDAEGGVLRRLTKEGPDELKSDVVVVPHHGGEVKWIDPADEHDFYETVGASYAVVSAGAMNHYGHPEPSVVTAARRDGTTRVMCTQVTPRCFGASTRETHRAAVRDPTNSMRPPDLPACAGEVTLHISVDGAWEIAPDPPTHDVVIDGWPAPQCRLSLRPATGKVVQSPRA